MTSINTHGIKYIGSKKTIIPYIIKLIEEKCDKIETAIDVFTGTTRVAQAFRQKGWTVTTSDLNWASEAYSNTFIMNKDNQHLQKYIDELNNIPPSADWITKNYCDAVGADGTTKVCVWQSHNSEKADAIRNKIEEYTELAQWEKMTLITSLIVALDKVDNTVGVQQAYLKEWCARSYNKMKLVRPSMPLEQNSKEWSSIFDIEALDLMKFPRGDHLRGDALKLIYPKSDIAYLDPPYSSHSYATYYHIWDSIVAWDKPNVALNTNRRVDRTGNTSEEMKSMWNSKTTATKAFEQLIERLPVKYIVISYNDESIVKRNELVNICNKYDKNGEAIYTEFDYKRNIMSSIGNAQLHNTTYKTENKEILILIEKC